MANIGTLLHSYLFGKMVGKDQLGNCYFVEKCNPKNRKHKRWVIYKGLPEPSKVPPIWHGWLHYTSDEIPTDLSSYYWEMEPKANLSGTSGAYYPPGHIKSGGKRDKVTGDYEAWQP